MQRFSLLLVCVFSIFLINCSDENQGPVCDIDGDTDLAGDTETVEMETVSKMLIDRQVDFGAVILGHRTTRELTVYSIGDAPLSIISVKLNSATSEIVLDNPIDETLIVEPSDEYAILLSYLPLDPGTDSATLDIYTNDPENQLVQISITSDYKGEATLSAAVTGNEPVRHIQSESSVIDITITAQPQNADDNRIITLSGIQLPASEHFSLVSSTAQTPVYLGPLMQHTIQVRFTPQSTGLLETQLTIQNDSDDLQQQPLVIPLSGTGGLRELSYTPSAVDFGVLHTGADATKTVQVGISDESYSIPVTITAITIENNPDALFALENPPDLPLILDAADGASIDIAYAPLAVEGNTAVLRITSDDHFHPSVEIPLSGTGAIRDLRTDTPGITFDPLCLGSVSQHNIRLSNSGGIPVEISSVTIDPATAPFTVSETFPLVIAAGETITVPVSYAAVQEGAASATISVTSNSDTTLTPMQVQATCLAPMLTRTPQNIVEFGIIHVADTATQRLTLENSGLCPVTVSSIGFSEGSSPAFSLDELTDIPLELQPEESYALDIAFDAQGATGDTWGTLQITTTLPEPVINAGIHATVIQPVIDISPAEGLFFGELHEGATSDPRTITIRNAGFGTLSITDISMEGTGAGAYMLTDVPAPLPINLLPGESAGMQVTFTPVLQQSYGASITITSNDRARSVVAYPVTGTGAPCPENYIDCDDDPRTCERFCIPSGDEVCDNRDNNCNCAFDETFEQLGESCAGVGVCSNGVIECDPANPLQVRCSTLPGGSQYNALDPSHTEVCDNRDNDCNGVVDDGFNTGTPCEGTGICPGGTVECFSETQSGCSTLPGGSAYDPFDPAHNEVCDEVDNNCNGETDELFGTGIPCDGQGTCGIGTVVCSGEYSVMCSTDIGGPEYDASSPEREEVCDGYDNDCDGQTDEGFNPGASCEGTGECGQGIIECKGLLTTICSTNIGGSDYDASSSLRQEICDGKDNDCDGSVDENWRVGETCDGIGECGIGIIECSSVNSVRCSTDPDGSQFNPNDPSHVEQCDHLDNDCDGNIDETFGIGLPCTGVGLCGEGTWECLSASERICSSMPGGSDSQAQAEVCNNVDDNCNGIIDDGYMTDPGDPNFFCLALGECGWGHMECINESLSGCSTDIGGSQYDSNDPLRQEVCDGRDNDCNGYFDEGFDVYDACDGTGECGIGVWECVWQTGDRRCSTDPGGSDAASDQGPQNETTFGIDGLDNDCDGVPDDPWKITIYRYRQDSAPNDEDMQLSRLAAPPVDYVSWGGAQFSLYDTGQTGFDEVMSFENTTATDHIYTRDTQEAAALDASWVYQGSLGYASATPGIQTIPVYRLYNAALSMHVYTVSETEKLSLLASGYEDQGTAFYAWQKLP